MEVAMTETRQTSRIGQGGRPRAGTASTPVTRRAAAAGAASLAAGGLLAACAGPGGGTAEPGGAPPRAERATVRVFNRGTPINEVVKGGADEYAAQHPNVTVEWESAPPGEDLQKMLAQAVGGTAPDVQWQCLVCNFHQYVLGGLYVDLQPLARARKYDLNQHVPSAVESGTHQGKLYGMPYMVHPSYPCVIINKTMFQQFGVPVPKEEWTEGPHPGWKDWTYEAMQQAAIALTRREGGRPTQWGFQMRGPANPLFVLIAAIRSEGSDYLDKDGKKLQLDTPQARKVIGYYADLYTKRQAAPLPADMPQGTPDLMAAGRVGIRNAPIWAIATAKQQFTGFEWQVLPAPRGAAGVDGFVEPNFFSINKSSRQPDLAFDVLTHLADPKWGWKSVEMGGIPGSHKEFWTPGSALTRDPAFAVFARMMNTVSPARLPANGRFGEFSTQALAELNPIFTGELVEADRLIQEMTPRLQLILNQPQPTIADLVKPS
jgi:multiple sugar transport system substrate-binding protein